MEEESILHLILKIFITVRKPKIKNVSPQIKRKGS